MKEVRLTFQNDDGSRGEIVGTFLDEDLALLKQYCGHVQRLRQTKIMKEGVSTVIKVGMPDENEVDLETAASFLHHLRPVFLAKEPASFDRVTGLISRRFSHKIIKRHMKDIRSILENSPYSGFGQFSIGGVPVWDHETIKQWLNGFEYHQDVDKRAYLADVIASLGEGGTTAAFIDQLRQQARAFVLLEALAQDIIEQ